MRVGSYFFRIESGMSSNLTFDATPVVTWSGKRDSSPRCARAIYRDLYLYPRPLKGVSRVARESRCLLQCKMKKDSLKLSSHFERKTRVCPSALHSIYQALTFAQYYTPNSRDTWEGSGCRFRVRLLPYKLQNYSCLRQIYE